MIRILFICHGNICRSPMAEIIMKDIVRKAHREDEFLIESRATSREELGNGIYPPARREIEAHGLPYNKNHMGMQVKASDYDEYDYLIIMDERNRSYLKRIIGDDPENKVSFLMDYTDNPEEIEDPWYTGNYHKVWNQIEYGCKAFWNAIK